MGLETSYYLVCDGCRNYAGYSPADSVILAINNAKRLGWSIVSTESKTYPGTQAVQAVCGYCFAAQGKVKDEDDPSLH